MKWINYVNFDKANKQNASHYLADEAGQWQTLRGKMIRFFFFYAHWTKYQKKIRIFGKGFCLENNKHRWIRFSERQGIKKPFILFGWKLTYLK